MKFWLPRGKRDDIVAELADDLQTQIEEREAALGRRIDGEELGEIVTRFGHPMLVAERYRSHPTRALIGPELFPVYRMLLQGFWLFYMLPWMAVWIVFALTPSYRADHPGAELFGTLWTWWNLGLYSFAFLTLGFAMLDRMQPRLKWFQSWNPAELRPVVDPNRIGRGNSFSALMSNIAVGVLWVWLPQHPTVKIAGAGEVVDPSVVWQTYHHTLFVPVLALLVVGAVLSGVNLFLPYWTRARLAAKIAVSSLGGLLAAIVLAAQWAGFQRGWTALGEGSLAPAAERARIWMDRVAYQLVALVAICCLISIVCHVVRLARWKP